MKSKSCRQSSQKTFLVAGMSITRVRVVILVESECGRQWPVRARVRHYMERGRHLRMRIM